MSNEKFPLSEVSVSGLYISGETCTYEIPIYQRNYAWEKDEIDALVQDVYDAFIKDTERAYYIGTLVTYQKENDVFEVIDGQQRLTTIYLILKAMAVEGIKNKLTYRARRKSDDTLKVIPHFDTLENMDAGIRKGYDYACEAYKNIVLGDKEDKKEGFKKFFLENVHIIHYNVPNDVDLNHYFEVMNSRGEQLEKHEIVKAELMAKLEPDDQLPFSWIWEACSNMSIYVQQSLSGLKIEKAADSSETETSEKTENGPQKETFVQKVEKIFGGELNEFKAESFKNVADDLKGAKAKQGDVSISDLINRAGQEMSSKSVEAVEREAFQPIIDFPNFLLIVLKLTLIKLKNYPIQGKDADNTDDQDSESFRLDDKELLNEFEKARLSGDEVKIFAYELLMARFFLDNYVVHHTPMDVTTDSNPWELQVYKQLKKEEKKQPEDADSDGNLQERKKLVQLLSMFEVSFTARQRKNYLFYILMYLMNGERNKVDYVKYAVFAEELADRYFNEVYLDRDRLNDNNTPMPGSFDSVMLSGSVTDGWQLNRDSINRKGISEFNRIYGDGTEGSKGVPLFIFNYMDHKLWKAYAEKGSSKRKEFFERLGCSDFGLEIFDKFYFSRTRRSLEHFYAQANATGTEGHLDQKQINCFGNYAMIGSDANSSGSNWDPKTKLEHYLQDSSGKIRGISVASLKFRVMLQMCQDNRKWEYAEIKAHQEKMLALMCAQ